MNAGFEQRQDMLKKAAIATDDKPFDIILGFLYGTIKLPIQSKFKLFKQFWLGIVILAFICIMVPVMVFWEKKYHQTVVVLGSALFCLDRPFVHDA